MLCIREYDREHAVAYAQKWALSRNPLFENYTGIGGDCTNFVSQCVFAGCCQMNFTETFGWYYVSPQNRAPGWTGVPYFFNFIINNQQEGPFADQIISRNALELGDIIQLGNRLNVWYHSLIVTGMEGSNILVSAHTEDSLNRSLRTYEYYRLRYIHILGARVEVENIDSCFEPLMNGEAIIFGG